MLMFIKPEAKQKIVSGNGKLERKIQTNIIFIGSIEKVEILHIPFDQISL